MLKRIFARDSAQPDFPSRNALARPFVWMLFLVSVGSFADIRAQSLSFPTDASMPEAFHKHQAPSRPAEHYHRIGNPDHAYGHYGSARYPTLKTLFGQPLN
jgi:hypothetical protein